MLCCSVYCTALHCTVLYRLYCIVMYCIVLYCTMLYCSVLCCTVLYCTVLHFIAKCMLSLPRFDVPFLAFCVPERDPYVHMLSHVLSLCPRCVQTCLQQHVSYVCCIWVLRFERLGASNYISWTVNCCTSQLDD